VVHRAYRKSANKELMPISELFSDTFLSSLDTELVRDVRIAGAKKVTISFESKQTNSNSTEVATNISTQSFSADAEIDTSNLFSSSDKKKVVYEFVGGETAFMHQLKNRFISPENEILRQSQWLQHDIDLTEFVRSCFSENKLKYYSKTINTKAQKDISSSAKIAAESKLITASGEGQASLQQKSDMFELMNKHYKVEF
jgi:hypothetical protein